MKNISDTIFCPCLTNYYVKGDTITFLPETVEKNSTGTISVEDCFCSALKDDNTSLADLANSAMKPMILSAKTAANYAILINGFLSPVIVLIAIINNLLVCVVLLKPHMRNPTNALLVAMAIADILTGVFPVPVFLHFFATERYWEYVPFKWCLASKYFADLIPTVFHTASIWLTMALAIQRYIYVCQGLNARIWCTMQNTIRSVAFIFALAFLCQLCRFLESYPVGVRIPSAVAPNKTVSACILLFHSWTIAFMDIYYSIYFWFRAIFVHLIPCISLVVVNALLIRTMKIAQKRRMALLQQNLRKESKKLKVS